MVFEWLLILTIHTSGGKAIAITTVSTKEDCNRIGKQWRVDTGSYFKHKYTCARKLKNNVTMTKL